MAEHRNFEVAWRTTRAVVDGKLTESQFAGVLVLHAPNIAEAARIAVEDLLDVDFLCPGDKLSASDDRVVGGWAPNIELDSFETIEITRVSEVRG